MLNVFRCGVVIPAALRRSGGVTPGRDKSNDLAGRFIALAPPCLLLCFGNSVQLVQFKLATSLRTAEPFAASVTLGEPIA